MKKSMFSSLIAWALVFTVVLTMLPAGLVLAEGETPAGDSGAMSVADSVYTESLILEDNCSSLLDFGWIRSRAGEIGHYITDSINSLNDSVSMKSVPEGQYLFFSSKNTIYSALTSKPLTIGEGPWYMEFDARITDLMTPSTSKIYRGMSFELYAGGKKYKVTFNSKDAEGKFSILVMKNAAGTVVDEKQATLPSDVLMHKWRISYLGNGNVTVSMDGSSLADFTGVSISDATPEKLVIYNSTYNLVSGTNEMYIDNLKLVKLSESMNTTPIPTVTPTTTPTPTATPNTGNIIFDEDCASLTALASKGWNVTDVTSGIYITDSLNSTGNPEGVIKQTTPEGNVLFFADETSPKDTSGVSALKFPLMGENQLQYKLTGEGKWYAEFNAKFDSLMKIGTYPGDSGFSTFIDTGAKVYRITFSPDNKIIVRNGAYGKYAEKTVDLHIGDGNYHKWAISHQGNGVISIVCDGKQVAFFTEINIDASIGSWGAYGVQFINASFGAVSGTNKVFFDSVKFAVNETAAGAVGDNSLIFNDDCTKLIDAGWTATEPKTGVFINDGANSVINPNNIQMPQIPIGQYMLYADGTVTGSNFTKMEKLINIGSGAWELQFDAKFKDLITPSANNPYRGVSFEIFANGLEYKIAFNDKDKILALTNASSGTFVQKQVTMPVDDIFHNWSIVYNGINKVYIKMDTNIVATFEGIALGAAAIPDKVVLVNASLNWSKGTNEVYIDNLKMIRTETSNEDPNLLLNDDCTNLVEANWSVAVPKVGAYITDSARSNGTILGLKSVEAGKYLFYGDRTASENGNKNYVSMTKNLSIGKGPWAIEFDARIIDLVTPSASFGYRGFVFDIYAGGKEYKLLFSSGNIIYAMTNAAGATAQKLEVTMPDSNTYHKWGIAFEGTDKVIVSLDGNKVGTFNNIGLSTAVTDRITILNAPLNWQSGTTEVYLDNIKMSKNTVPEWAKFDPKINGCTVLPDSNSTQLNLVASTYDVNPEWLKDENVTVQAVVYKEDLVLDSAYARLDNQLIPLTLNLKGNTGRIKLVMKLMNGSAKIDEITRNIELDAEVIFIEPSQEIKAEADKTYIFDRVGELTDVNGRDVLSAGWRKVQYSYEGTNNIFTVVESVYDSQSLVLPVKAEGWFGVYVGYVSGTQEFKVSDGYTEKTVVIEKEEDSQSTAEVDQYGNKLICESFAFAADFKGNGIKIDQSNNRNARIAYIKLKSLSAEEIALYTKANEGAQGNRVVYNNDGYSDFFMGYYTDVNKLKELVVDRYAGQDVGEFDWTLGTTFMLNYESQYAGVPYQDVTPIQEQTLMRDGDKKARDSILGFINAGINPGEVIAQRADELGIDTNMSLRMSAFYDMSTYPWLNGSIYKDFVNGTVDYRYVNKDGTKQNRLSYAYPEFREYIKNILKEAASFKGVDGVNLDFCRYPDVLGYEPILTDAYKAKYGVDPKTETTTEGINRWNQYKADVMTEFMRELRSEIAGKNISVRIPYKDYFQYGLDVQKWVNDGLIDVLIPSCIGYEDFYDITPFANMVKGSNVKLYGGINADLAGHDLTKQEEDLIKRGVPVTRDNKYLNTQQYRLRARELYNAGSEKIYIFNSWKGQQSLGLLGDKVELEKWFGLAYPAEWVENPVTVKAPVSEYLTSIKVGNKTVGDFVYDKTEYVVTLAYGTVNVPEVSVGTIDPKAKVEITNSATLGDVTTISVTSSDGSKTIEYKVSFKVTPKQEDPDNSYVPPYVPEVTKPDNTDLLDALKESIIEAGQTINASDKTSDEKLKLLEKHKNEAAQLINIQLESQALKLEGKSSQDKVTFEAKTDAIQKSIENFKSIRKEALEAIKDTSLSKAESLVENAVVLDAKNVASGKSIELTIPQDAIKALEKAGMDGVAVLTPTGKIVLSVKDIAGDKDVKLLVKAVEADTKNSSLSTPIDVEVQADGKVIEAFAQKIKIEVPLKSVPQNPDLIAVFKIKDNGEEELVPAKYIESTNTVVFLRPSLSKYYAAEYVKKFNDVDDGKWYSTYIKAAAAKGAINGYTDGTFKPEEQITRAEFAAMVVKTFGIEYSSQEVSKFNDVNKNDWHYNFIATLYNKGIINGKNESSFAPDEYISREEMAALIVKAMIKLGIIEKLQDGEAKDFNDASSISDWAGAYVTTAYNEGLIGGTGNGSFEPSRGITRAETAAVITRALMK